MLSRVLRANAGVRAILCAPVSATQSTTRAPLLHEADPVISRSGVGRVLDGCWVKEKTGVVLEFRSPLCTDEPRASSAGSPEAGVGVAIPQTFVMEEPTSAPREPPGTPRTARQPLPPPGAPLAADGFRGRPHQEETPWVVGNLSPDDTQPVAVWGPQR